MRQTPFRREEWDFSQCPEAHLEACYYYEFARESDRAREAERAYQAAIQAAPEREALWLRTCRLRGVYNFFQCCPEFPDTPFLCIPKPERDARIAALFKMPRLIQADLSSIICTHEPTFSQAKTLKYQTGFGEGDIAAFYVNWGIPLLDLEKDFRTWLEKNKPPGPPIRSKNGAGASVRQKKKWLKALGALRLLRRKTWSDAHEFTSKSLRKKNGEPCGLFSCEPSAWGRAKRDAEKAIGRVGRLIEALTKH